MTERQVMDDFFKSIQHFGSKPGLTVIKTLLKELGHPEENLKVIHIVGTNGKGSSAMMLEKILLEGKYKTGVFTSPSFTSFDGGIRINGQSGEETILLSAMAKVMKACKSVQEKINQHPTPFEVEVGLALEVFKQSQVDFAIVEAGLGGKLDATNVFDHPEGVLITRIGIDHQAFLGNKVEEIARQKAGVIKPFTKVVSQPQCQEVERVLFDEATVVNGKLTLLHESAVNDVHITKTGTSFSYRGVTYKTNLVGEHQACNAAGVIRLLEVLNITLSKENIERGLMNVVHPGRLEIIHDQPLTIIDGAHNVDGVKALVKSLEGLAAKGKFDVVFGVMKDKDIHEMLKALKPFIHHLYPLSVEHARSESVDAIAKVCDELGIELTDEKLLEGFLNTGNDKLIVGSLYIQSSVKIYL